jgi:hypothetical protein
MNPCETALLALHDAYLDQQRRVRSLRAEVVALGQALSESRKAAQRSSKREVQRTRECARLEQEARAAERNAGAAEQRAEAAERNAEAAERRAGAAEQRAEAAERRAEAAERRAEAAESGEAAARREGDRLRGAASKAEAVRAEQERSARNCRELLEAFKGRTRELREEVRQYSERAVDASAFLCTAARMETAAVFTFDDEEVRAMASAVMHNVLAPVDVRFVCDLFRLPMSPAESSVEQGLGGSRIAEGRGGAASPRHMCRSGSEVWRFVRNGMRMLWNPSRRPGPHWELMRVRPSRLLAMLHGYFEAVSAHVARGAAEADPDTSAPAALPPCADPDTVSVVQALNLLAQDAGSPWSRSVEVVMQPECALDTTYLARHHGIYGFRRRCGSVAYRFFHCPDEAEPVGVTGSTLNALFQAVADQAPQPPTAPAVPRDACWDRHCRGMTIIAGRVLAAWAARDFAGVPPGPARDGMLVRLLGHAATTMPHLSVTDFAVSYRSLMLTRHQEWVLRRTYYKLTGQESLPAATGAAGAGAGSGTGGGGGGGGGAEDVGSSTRPVESVMPFDTKLLGSEGPVASAQSPKDPIFRLPMLGMPGHCANPPVEMRFRLVRGRCRVEPGVARSAASMDVCRNTQMRVFLSFSDEPEAARFGRIADWEELASEQPPRFVLGYSRVLALGMRVHAFVLTPAVYAGGPKASAPALLDLPGLAADLAALTRLALGAMVGMIAPKQPPAPHLAELMDAVIDQFFPTPNRSGHAFLLELLSTLYTAINGETLLRVYD